MAKLREKGKQAKNSFLKNHLTPTFNCILMLLATQRYAWHFTNTVMTLQKWLLLGYKDGCYYLTRMAVVRGQEWLLLGGKDGCC